MASKVSDKGDIHRAVKAVLEGTMKVHRWQPTGYTPCGRKIDTVTTNIRRPLDDGVTCQACKNAKTRISLWADGVQAWR